MTRSGCKASGTASRLRDWKRMGLLAMWRAGKGVKPWRSRVVRGIKVWYGTTDS